MRKFLIFAGVVVTMLILLYFAFSYYNLKNTKQFSPEEFVSFQQDGLVVTVFYNRPYKKGRQIFGGLVPYGKVWRTGANEATTFETTQDLMFESKVLRKGKYSLWTIPGEETWTIIFNSEFGQWGVNASGEANRDPSRDVLTVSVRPVQPDVEFEQFTIAFEQVGEDAEMVLIWDKTLVSVPFSYRPAN